MKLLLTIVLAASLAPPAGAGGPQPDEAPWGELSGLVGAWDGKEQGQSGLGSGDRTYEFVLGGRYLHAKNTSRFPPQPANPKGEVHEDWKFFSYDRDEAALALREFHSEGFVNSYLLDKAASSDRRWVFRSRHLENFSGQARYTMELRDDGTLEELFEVAHTGKPLQVVVKNRWTRRRP